MHMHEEVGYYKILDKKQAHVLVTLSYIFVLASCRRVNRRCYIWNDKDYKLALTLLNF